jgi:AraC-like DNA-binding protein
MIVEFGPPLAIFTRRPDESVRFTGGFVAGICTGVTQTRHEGLQAGVQIGLTPLGAFQLLRRPIAEIAELAVGLRPFLPRRWRQLDQMLAEAPDWDRRFDLVEAALSDLMIRANSEPHLLVVAATQRIIATGGQVDMQSLVEYLGYSARYVIQRFRTSIGVTPKVFARITRFDAAMRAMRDEPQIDWTQLALDHGFYDQSHLSRDIRAFTGMSPTKAREVFGDFGDVWGGD